MEDGSRIGEQEIGKQKPRRETGGDDEVLAPIWEAQTMDPHAIVQRRAEFALLTDAQAKEDAEKVVALELRLVNDNPEKLWETWKKKYSDISRTRFEMMRAKDQAKGSEFGALVREGRMLRHHLNALVPRLAEWRIQTESSRYDGPDAYANDLNARLERTNENIDLLDVEAFDALGESVEEQVRLADFQDQAAILERQIAFVRDHSHEIAWNRGGHQRSRVVRGESVAQEILDSAIENEPEDLPASANEYTESTNPNIEQRRISLARLRMDREKLGFFAFGAKAEIDGKIQELMRREAYEAKKYSAVLKKEQDAQAVEAEKSSAGREPQVDFFLSLKNQESELRDIRQRYDEAKRADDRTPFWKKIFSGPSLAETLKSQMSEKESLLNVLLAVPFPDGFQAKVDEALVVQGKKLETAVAERYELERSINSRLLEAVNKIGMKHLFPKNASYRTLTNPEISQIEESLVERRASVGNTRQGVEARAWTNVGMELTRQLKKLKKVA